MSEAMVAAAASVGTADATKRVDAMLRARAGKPVTRQIWFLQADVSEDRAAASLLASVPGLRDCTEEAEVAVMEAYRAAHRAAVVAMIGECPA